MTQYARKGLLRGCAVCSHGKHHHQSYKGEPHPCLANVRRNGFMQLVTPCKCKAYVQPIQPVEEEAVP